MLTLADEIENESNEESPLMLLYHINIGYPLLSETAVLQIPSCKVVPREVRSAEGLDSWNVLLPPTSGFTEQCYYHALHDKEGSVSVWNPAVGRGLEILFDTESPGHFTQWKQMDVRDYVLGLESGTFGPKGRKTAN